MQKQLEPDAERDAALPVIETTGLLLSDELIRPLWWSLAFAPEAAEVSNDGAVLPFADSLRRVG